MRKFLVLILFFFIFLISKSYSFVRNFVESVKIIKISSVQQKIENFNKLILNGNVDVWVDQKMHIWADEVEIDKEKQFLIAKKKDNSCSSVIIENSDFLILADKFFLNLDNKTGYAENVRIQISQGYITSARAEKLGENQWKMEDICYTPCDSEIPHWSIIARQATLYNNYLIRINGLIFKIGQIPFFILPTMVLPVQNKSNSGFLLPKISYDDELGFGIRQDYYWYIAPRCDSTLGIDWKVKRGIAFSDEFRWVRHPEKFTFINAQYAIEKNAFVKKGDKIVKKTDQRYWINGKDFSFFDIKFLPNKKLYSLARVDFGTDKRIGYQFFDVTKGLDDTFYNSFICRSIGNRTFNTLMFDSKETSFRQFSNLTKNEEKEIFNLLPAEQDTVNQWGTFSKKKEIEDKVTVLLLPHFEHNSAFYKFKNLFFYKQDFFVDQVLSRSKKVENFYVNSSVVKETVLRPLAKADTLRFFYSGNLQSNLKFKEQFLKLYFKPILQLRSKTKISSDNKKKYRFFLGAGAEWDFPENSIEWQDTENNFFCNYFFQPSLKWDFLLKEKQDNWFYSDNWDRIYPQNQIEFYLRNNWYLNNLSIDLNIYTAVEFYNKSDIFPLRRYLGQKHFLPPKFELTVNSDLINLFFSQEYEWRNFKLLQSQLSANFNLGQFSFTLGTLYQNEGLRKEREFLSDISHFIFFRTSFPLSKSLRFNYNGQFYSSKNSNFLPFEGLRDFAHNVRLDYKGHCWGVSIGFEEKKYRECGDWKSEHSFSLFVKLESLGSFARKFKAPPVYRAG
ncbi:MAG: hypothetical protein WC436_04920 [Candidatus Babeliales bacterium]